MDTDESQLFQYSTPQPNNNFKRPRRSLQSSTPLSSVTESTSPSPRLSGHAASLTPDVIEHINGLKHLDDKSILLLLEAARSGDRMRIPGPDRSSMSTIGSRASSYLSVPSSRASILSDPRSSIASTDSSFTHYSAASSRLSTASSRLSTISNTSAPKNFACTFCDKALKSKPYWKSHEEEFHEQRLTWRCPDCEQIFHAGKRFREHHTKLHGCENCKQPRESGQPTSRKASPCVKKYEIVMHDKDAWGCGFCACLLSTWEERCEHIAMHFEEKKNKWNFTNVILGLLKQSDVLESWNRLMTQRHGDESNWPRLTWESKKCNRLRYKLETKWDTRVFDVDKIVSDTYEMAEIEPNDVAESTSDSTPEVQDQTDGSELVDCKMEPFDFANDQGMQTSHTLHQNDAALMDLDPVEPQQSMHQDMHHSQWPVSNDMAQTTLSQSTMAADSSMGAFGGFNTHMTHMTTDFSQPVNQGFQPSWPNNSFVSTPDLVGFQQPTSYMNYNTQPKEVVPVPTSQYTNFGQYPRQSVPPNFMHHPTSSRDSRRFIPKLVSIGGSSHRASSSAANIDQPPPPPPKDEHTNRFSRMIMRRRPSNISQHTVVSQRDIGWNDELNWG